MNEEKALELLWILYNSLLNDNWHIGDGVDDCVGTDDFAMYQSAIEITKRIVEVIKEGE